MDGILTIEVPGEVSLEFPLPCTTDGRPFVPAIDSYVQKNGYRAQVVAVIWNFDAMQVVVIANLILKV